MASPQLLSADFKTATVASTWSQCISVTIRFWPWWTSIFDQLCPKLWLIQGCLRWRQRQVGNQCRWFLGVAVCHVVGFHRQMVAMSWSFVVGLWSYDGQAVQPMADGDINCGQSMQKRCLVVTGCCVVGFRWLPTMRFLRCCRMPKGGVEISPFWVPMRLWHLQRLWPFLGHLVLHASHGAIYSLCGCNCMSWYVGMCFWAFCWLFYVFGSWVVCTMAGICFVWFSRRFTNYEQSLKYSGRFWVESGIWFWFWAGTDSKLFWRCQFGFGCWNSKVVSTALWTMFLWRCLKSFFTVIVAYRQRVHKENIAACQTNMT